MAARRSTRALQNAFSVWTAYAAAMSDATPFRADDAFLAPRDSQVRLGSYVASRCDLCLQSDHAYQCCPPAASSLVCGSTPTIYRHWTGRRCCAGGDKRLPTAGCLMCLCSPAARLGCRDPLGGNAEQHLCKELRDSFGL